jgi:PEP-CTERM motif
MKNAIHKIFTLLGNTTFAVTVVDVGKAAANGKKQVPEPASFLLLSTGIAGLAWWMRKRK